VICRSAGIARTFSKTLKHGVDHALSLGGHFDFAPGVLVTAVPEVKGLEFDYVFVPDADSNTYPDAAESRRTLYVAVTRATHRLAVCAAGNWSSLLPPRA
jgi:DNA helicase II / ATP-dependent DNA helicase PcrA